MHFLTSSRKLLFSFKNLKGTWCVNRTCLYLNSMSLDIDHAIKENKACQIITKYSFLALHRDQNVC